jgi:DNA polymerase
MNDSPRFFDAMVECLKREQGKSPCVSISPEVLDGFYGTIHAPQSASAPAPAPAMPPPRNAPAPGAAAPAPKNAPPPPAPVPKPVLQRHQSITPCPVGELSLDELRLLTLTCRNCGLHQRRTNVVFGEGNPKAKLMFIGEGPGMDEDQQGRPFVGAAGQLLTKMINAMQFSRDDVYIANIVKCRPPNNRVPLPDEANVCLPYLERQVELIQPQVIVLLGATPLQYILGLTGIMRRRGQWGEYKGIKVMPTYHPAFLLRRPEAKRDVWNDLQEVMKLFGKAHRR